MPRVRELTFDNIKVKISPLSWDEAEVYIKEGRDMLATEPKPTLEDWAKRTVLSVVRTLNKGAGNSGGEPQWTPEKVRSEFDMVTIQQIYDEFMKMSGLMKVETPGEVPATSTSL